MYCERYLEESAEIDRILNYFLRKNSLEKRKNRGFYSVIQMAFSGGYWGTARETISQNLLNGSHRISFSFLFARRATLRIWQACNTRSQPILLFCVWTN